MTMLTIKKKAILFSVLIICLIWLGYVNLGMGNKSSVSVINNEEAASIEVEEGVTIDANLSENNSLPVIDQKQGNDYDDYFVNYRIEREKIRSQQIEILREIVDNPNSVSEVRKEAQEKMLNITQTLENELKLENLIRAKNFQDAVVLIQPESVMVVVKETQLSGGDGMKIADLVSNTTGHNYEDIIITTKE